MLLNFTIKNWMSFRDKVTLSLTATRERQHRARVSKIKGHETRVLPITALYGGNASGKTNLFKALNFVKNLVVEGTRINQLIAVDQFRLDAKSRSRPSYFAIDILADEKVYGFSFALTEDKIVEEKLVAISSTGEKTYYHRQNDKITFGPKTGKAEARRLKFIFETTRDNELFLTSATSKKMETFLPVYDWFYRQLRLIAPDTRFGSFHKILESPFNSLMNETLSQLDTGIKRLVLEEIPFSNIPFHEELKNEAKTRLKEGNALVGISAGTQYFIFRKNRKLIAKKLFAVHASAGGKETQFDMRRESDGSQRLINLIPLFLDVTNQERASNSVYVVDEMDRSLHGSLVWQLVKSYLAFCSEENRAQLLFTTHNVMMMDQSIMRRDEMWAAERDALGVSTLIPFSAYDDLRNDSNIRKIYLQGRMGGVPRMLYGDALRPLIVTDRDDDKREIVRQ